MNSLQLKSRRTSTGGLIIHVGPPKTATTSVQVAAERLDLKDYIYGGVNQPRARNKMSFAHKLHLACASARSEDWAEGTKAAKDIREKCAQGYTVFISEEMFMVHSADVGWDQKVVRLRQLLADMPVKLMFTLRKPSDALPSLYQQLHKNLPFDLKMSFPKFCRSKYAECFDYEFCEKTFQRAGFTYLAALQFDNLNRNEISVRDIFGSEHECAEVPVPLSWENKSAAAEEGRLIGEVSLKDFVKEKGPARLKVSIFSKKERFPRLIYSVLARIPIRRAGRRALKVPADVASSLDRVYFSKLVEYAQPVPSKNVTL